MIENTQEQPVEREEHIVTMKQSELQQGENTFICSHCGQPITLVWDGMYFRLRLTDADNPDFGTVSITVEKEP